MPEFTPKDVKWVEEILLRIPEGRAPDVVSFEPATGAVVMRWNGVASYGENGGDEE